MPPNIAVEDDFYCLNSTPSTGSKMHQSAGLCKLSTGMCDSYCCCDTVLLPGSELGMLAAGVVGGHPQHGIPCVTEEVCSLHSRRHA